MKKINTNSFSIYTAAVAVILVIVVIFTVVVCCGFFNLDSGSASVNDSAYYQSICNFRCIYRNVDIGFNDTYTSIYVDTNTGILYLAGYGKYRSFMSPLYNADGTLKIWKGEVKE